MYLHTLEEAKEALRKRGMRVANHAPPEAYLYMVNGMTFNRHGLEEAQVIAYAEGVEAGIRMVVELALEGQTIHDIAITGREIV